MTVNLSDRRGRVEQLQKMLRYLGLRWKEPLLQVAVCGAYNEQTEAAVRAFQERARLPVTGICDRATWDAIAADYKADCERCAPVMIRAIPDDPDYCLGSGAKGEEVHLMQRMLNEIGQLYPLGEVPVTGEYDTATERAVREFQRMMGMSPTGMADRETWHRLAEEAEGMR